MSTIQEKELLKIGIEGNDLVIRISKSGLAFVAVNNPDTNYRVIDVDGFAGDVSHALQTMGETGESLSLLKKLFDQAIDEAYESGNDNIINLDENNEP